MKKFLKWLGIIIGTIFILILIVIAVILVRHDRYGIYASGGILSENQAQYDVLFYDLNLEIFSKEQAIAGYNSIKLKSLTDSLNIIELNLINNFNVSKISDNANNELSFNHKKNKLWINLRKPLQKGETVDLKVRYAGQPVEAIIPPWIGGFNWSKDAQGNDWIGVCCQAEGAKIWFPCKDHPSDEPDSVAINITVPEPYYCASNGVLRNLSTPRPGFQTFHWITHYPINNYDISINIAKYQILERKYIAFDGSTMPVYFYVLPEARDGADEHLDMALDMLYTYRKYYGEYPFTKEKFAIVHTNYLGMEHQTINSYGNKYRYQVVNGQDYDWLMLHEMGHEWWGNKVSVKDWADFWIHEGICTYGEALFQLDKGGEEAYHEYMKKLKRRIRNKKPIILKRNANSMEAYSSDIYMKGAYVMHSLRYVLGDSIFFETLRQFATDSAYIFQTFVSTEDFINLVNKNANADYSRLINFYLYTIDLPEIHITESNVNTYNISIPNIDFKMPMAVKTDEGVRRMELGMIPLIVKSKTKPIVDEKEWYLKKTPEKES